MDIAEFLRRRDADLPAVVASAEATVGLEPGDILLAVGSLVEGLGNSKSDLDLLLITPRDVGSFASREIALVVGKCISDVQVLPLLELETLLARFKAWAELPWDVTHAANFTLDERRLLHRLLHCSVLFEGRQARNILSLPRQHDLSRMKLHVARQISRTIQVDMVGNRESGDYASLTFAAQELLGHAVDALAAGHHFTNPTAKWRSRVLESVPADWEGTLGTRPTGRTASQLFWYLHRAPEHPDRRLALEHAFRIATFARGVFAWAQRRLLNEADEPQDSFTWLSVEREPQDAPLPYLDLDVDFAYSDGGVSIGRLNEFGDPVELSSSEFAIALLFDGVTTPREAEILIHGAYPSEVELRLVDRVLSRVARAGFSVWL